MLDRSQLKAVADIVRLQAQALGDSLALVDGATQISYAELDRRASQVAQGLIGMGVKPGDRVAVLAKNAAAFYELLFGCAKARATLAPVNFRLAPPEAAFILQDAKVKALFVGADFHELAKQALSTDETPPPVFALETPEPGWTDYAAWRDANAAADPCLPEQPDDDVVQLYTSGTTGLPKGVRLANATYAAFLKLSTGVEGFRYEPGEAVLNAMPLFHVAGANVGVAALAQGCRVIVLRDLVPATVLKLIEQERIAHAFFVPAVILMLMQAPEMAAADLTSMRTVSYGASPIAEDLLKAAKARFGCSFLQFYGMTESTGAGTYLPPDAHDPARGKLRSCGVPWPGIEVKVVDAAGREVPTGEVGEIVIKAPIVMAGYWNRPDATAETIRDGWLRTGDAAYRDADGYFFIHDRVKDMIVSGGENIYPAEVENAIFGCPAVADVAVIGVPDERWGEAVKACVVLKPGAEADPAAIISWARERIAAYKAPKSVDFVPVIPRNASGKILRRELRKPYWEGKTRHVN